MKEQITKVSKEKNFVTKLSILESSSEMSQGHLNYPFSPEEQTSLSELFCLGFYKTQSVDGIKTFYNFQTVLSIPKRSD